MESEYAEIWRHKWRNSDNDDGDRELLPVLKNALELRKQPKDGADCV